MIEKTDIPTLMRDMRDLADRIVECQGENSNGEEIIHLYDQSDTTSKAQNILLVLNAFEAERQRAERAEQALESECDIHIDTQQSMREWKSRAEKADSRLHEVSVHCANVEAELAALRDKYENS